ncbi:DUF58 domain-containing protein [Natronorarus salvus]|uniref:DUF58 domain-containing protein n=1 Tax=Natronorarus salvus TaxID=3117733 RepID=UPI002F26AAF5
MKVTRRGWTVALVAVAGFAMASLFGARSLNALVAPALIALAFAALSVSRIDRPGVERPSPEPGFPGERRTIETTIESDSAALVTVEEEFAEGLSPKRTRFETTLDAGALETEVELRSRGAYRLGPLTLTVTDPFGLVSRSFGYTTATEVVIYPRIHDLEGPGRYDLSVFPEAERAERRQEFDRLRMYERGDSLRDVHWKTSAKRPSDEFVVKQFVDETDPGGIHVVAEGVQNPDGVASAAASVVDYLLSAGTSASLAVGDGSVEEGLGARHRRAVLDILARTEARSVPPAVREGADVLVRAESDGIVVSVEGASTGFDRLAGETDGRAIADGGVR